LTREGKVLIKRRDGQFDWLSEEEAHKLIKAGRALQCDPKTFMELEKQPVEVVKPVKKQGKKKPKK